MGKFDEQPWGIPASGVIDSTLADSFQYEVCDGAGLCVTAAVTVEILAINDPPIAADDIAITDEDTPVGVDVLANDSDVDSTSLLATVVDQPVNGLAAPAATGATLVYTPNPGFCGLDSFTYQASDGVFASNIATVSLGVACVNHPPVAADDAATTSEDTAVGIDVVANDSDVDGDLVLGSVAPAVASGSGQAVAVGDGTIRYTPPADRSGQFLFTYDICDSRALCDTATVTVDVIPVNDAPVATDDAVNTDEDVVVTVDVLANDTDVDDTVLSLSIVDAPVDGLATVVAGGIEYVPPVNFSGDASIAYSVCDPSASCDTAIVSITVVPVDDAPLAGDDVYSIDQDVVLDVAAPGVLVNDVDVEGAVLSATLDTQAAAGVAMLDSAGSFRYTPGAGFCGFDSFTYMASDGGLSSAPATVTIEVRCVNGAPSVVDDEASTDEDTEVVIDVLANDTDDTAIDPSTLAVLAGPASGVVEVTPDHRIRFAPALDMFGGVDFTYEVCDFEAVCSAASVVVTVWAVNDAPVAGADAASTLADTAVDIDVLANDNDVDGDDLTPSLVDPPLHGSAVVVAGTIAYTPDSGACGVDTFTYLASDGLLSSVPATVTVDFECRNEEPVAVDDVVSLDEDTTVLIDVIANDSDDGDLARATVRITGTPPSLGNATVQADRTIRYAPFADSNGTDRLVYELCDYEGACDTAVVVILVVPVNDAPTCQPLVGDVQLGDYLNLDALCADIDGDELDLELATAPANGTATIAGTTITATPDQPGQMVFSYAAFDGTLSSVPAPVAIDVVAPVLALEFEKLKFEELGGSEPSVRFEGHIDAEFTECPAFKLTIEGVDAMAIGLDAQWSQWGTVCVAKGEESKLVLVLDSGDMKGEIRLPRFFDFDDNKVELVLHVQREEY